MYNAFIFHFLRYMSGFTGLLLIVLISWTFGSVSRSQKIQPKVDSLEVELQTTKAQLKKTTDSLRWYTTGPPANENVDDDVLWFARALYSETNRRREMIAVGWSIRNRVETCYRGRCTYTSVTTDPWQYSGLNESHPHYHRNMMPMDADDETWRTAVKVAWSIKHAPKSLNLFNKTARHFWSPTAMRGTPHWAYGKHDQIIMRSEPIERIPEKSRFVIYTNLRPTK